MIELLYMVIVAEMALILTLIFKTPLRKLVIMSLDKIKRGRGPVMVKTVAMTVFVVLVFSLYSMAKIQNRTIEAGAVNPTDQVLMAKHMLEASLMGFLLFLSLMIDRLHHYIRELRLLRKTMEAAKKQNKGHEDGKNAEELTTLEQDMATLRGRIKKLESECETKTGDAKAAEAKVEALRKQSEGLLMEYDHLLEENQNLRNQLESIDQNLSQSDNKKSI
ncbi:B-cell receptor-associated protein [Trema orientale]|uniref:Endoplasmic reticulum transmembrane protein n=1 Tax=Trema orientale TaxID=63057 RepID=A0A2P5CMH6_TREOI|nr:B-cell receptor-associated protein [Trema orientale]